MRSDEFGPDAAMDVPMDVPFLPVSVPISGGSWARLVARAAPLVFLAGVAVCAWLLLGSPGLHSGAGRAFSEAIPLGVAPAQAGRLAEVLVRVGQEVKGGSVIAKLDTREATLLLERARAERLVAEATLAAEASREDAAVMRAEVWRLRTVASSKSDKASLNALDRELGRLNGLLDDRLVKASEVEPRLREREALAARIGIFERARGWGQAGLDEDPKHPMSDKHQSIIDVRVAPLREGLRVKDLEVAQLDLRLAGLTLRAPADGVVSTINVRAGEMVTAGQPAVTIVAHRPGVFEAYVPERRASSLRVGTPVALARPGLWAHTESGHISEVAPEVGELPIRLRSAPQVPAWGRRILIDASDSETMRTVLPGEEIRFRF